MVTKARWSLTRGGLYSRYYCTCIMKSMRAYVLVLRQYSVVSSYKENMLLDVEVISTCIYVAAEFQKHNIPPLVFVEYLKFQRIMMEEKM